MVHISLSPNVQADDVRVALRRLFSWWSWSERGDLAPLVRAFSERFKNDRVYFLSSGRGALFLAMRALALKPGDEVVVQAFTCNAVVNPVRWAGATPVYVDIDGTFNIDVSKLRDVLTERTRAVVVQHTFGIPARIDEIIAIAKERNIAVIEDCAHALGATYRGTAVGTFGDMSIFSFGRDKVISSVFGGALLVNNAAFNNGVAGEYEKLKTPAMRWVLQQLVHPPFSWFALKTYRFGGKYMLIAAQKLHILSRVVTQGERVGEQAPRMLKKMPRAFAALALNQFKKLNVLNRHRRMLAAVYEHALSDNPYFGLVSGYDEGSMFLRYPVTHNDAPEILLAARRRGMVLGDWYREIIAPEGTDLAAMRYRTGSCSTAESRASRIINLPTNIRTSEKDAQRIVDFLLQWHS
jgi:perosamine synthetase